MEAKDLYLTTKESCIAIPIPSIITDAIDRVRQYRYPMYHDDRRNNKMPANIKLLHPFKVASYDDKNLIKQVLQHVKPFNVTLKSIAIKSDAKYFGSVMLYVKAFSDPPSALPDLRDSLLKAFHKFTDHSYSFLGVALGFVTEQEAPNVMKTLQAEWEPITFHVSGVSLCKLLLTENFFYGDYEENYLVERAVEVKSVINFGDKPVESNPETASKAKVIEVNELHIKLKPQETSQYFSKLSENNKNFAKELDRVIRNGDLTTLDKIIVADPTQISNPVCEVVKTAQTKAALDGSLELLKILLKFPIRFFDTYSHIVSSSISHQVISVLANGCPSFFLPNSISSLLIQSCSGQSPIELLRWILQSNRWELKADTIWHNKTHVFPLEVAVTHRNYEAVKALLESKKAQANTIFPKSNRTALHLAAELGNAKIVQLLLDNHADPNKSLNNIGTPLDICKDPECRNILLKYTKLVQEKVKEYSGDLPIDHKQKAVIRILRDLKEFYENPLDNIDVIPSERDFFNIHVILSPPRDTARNPYRGLKFHFTFRLPDTYPVEPPKVSCQTLFKHPNVFSETFICLDMITYDIFYVMTDRSHSSQDMEGKKVGWTPAYTLYSVLMQFQAFLFDEYVPQSYGEDRINEVDYQDVKKATENAKKFSCSDCGYNVSFGAVTQIANANFSKVTVIKQEPKKVTSGVISGVNSIFKLRDDELLLITDLLTDPVDLYYFMKTCKRFRNLVAKHHVWERRELVCFFSKRHFTEDILGVGIHVERQGTSSRLRSVTTAFDLLSRKAFFEDQVREAVWGQPFEYFLPLVLNPKHAKKSMPLLKSALVAILKDKATTVDEHLKWSVHTNITRRTAMQIIEEMQKFEELGAQFHPLMVLDVIPKLMNNVVVEFMKEEKSGIVPLQSSEKALQGYCQFHHMILKLALEFPQLQNEVNKRIHHFIQHQSRRVKLAIPDLGEFLVCLALSRDIRWEQFALPFIKELLDRQVLWTLDRDSGNHGELCFLETQEISKYRLEVTFSAGLTGLRLLMFQYFFLTKIARPTGKSLEAILSQYDDSYGFPEVGLPARLQSECKKIHKVGSYRELFEYVGVAYPGDAAMTSWLRDAVVGSEKKGYHKNRMSQLELFNWRCSVDTSLDKVKDAPKEEVKKEVSHGKGYKVELVSLSRKIDEKVILSTFQQFGEILDVKLVRDEKGEPDYAHLTFSDYESAESASIFGQGVSFFGRTVRTNFLDRKQREYNSNHQRKDFSNNSNRNSNYPKREGVPEKRGNQQNSKSETFYKSSGNNSKSQSSYSKPKPDNRSKSNNQAHSKKTQANSNSNSNSTKSTSSGVATGNIFDLLGDEM